MKISRWFDTSQTQLLVLAPSAQAVPKSFRYVDVCCDLYCDLLAGMQRFRGGVYLRDAAISASALTRDGRHRLEIDESSWHVLTLERNGAICGCTRYLPHLNSATFEDLWVRNSALTRSPVWGSKLRAAIEAELSRARRIGLPYVEVGGWAVSEDRRWSCDALCLALSTFSLARCLGGCLGVTTATVKHASSSILRRIGGRSFAVNGEELPEYYDPRYGCEMEMLRFDSRFPDPKYCNRMEEIDERMAGVPVIGRTKSALVPMPAHRPTTPGRAVA